MKHLNLLVILLLYSKVVFTQKNSIESRGYLYSITDGIKDNFLLSKRIYDSDTNLVEEVNNYFQDGKYNSTLLKYSSSGKIVLKESYFMDSTYYQKVIFIRNMKGDIEKQIIIDNENEVGLLQDNKYDSLGRLVKSDMKMETLKDVHGVPRYYSLFSYDSNGNLVKLQQYHDDSLIREDTYIYDNRNRRIEEKSVIINPQYGGITVSKFVKNDLDCILYQENYQDGKLETKITNTWNNKLLRRSTTEYMQEGQIEDILFKEY